MSSYSKLACFVGGALFGTFGIQMLSTKEAKDFYVKAAATGLRMKDSVMETVTTVQEEVEDILASAKDLNEERAAKKADEEADAIICDACEDVCEDACEETCEDVCEDAREEI